jgi:hypothetical protein
LFGVDVVRIKLIGADARARLRFPLKYRYIKELIGEMAEGENWDPTFSRRTSLGFELVRPCMVGQSQRA